MVWEVVHNSVSYRECLNANWGGLGWLSRLSVGLLINTQVIISGSWDQAPHQAACLVQSLHKPPSPPLPLPISLSL